MKRNRRNWMYLIIAIAILGGTLGFAYLNTSLAINGVVDVSSSSWDIYWNNIQLGSNNVTDITTPATIQTGKTEVLFNVNFKEPGDTYEFTVDAVNNGTINAMIDTFSKGVYAANGTTPKNLPDYLEYTVTYSDGVAIANHQLLSANSTETYKVRVHFKENITASQLPSTADNYMFKFSVTYVQADSNAIPVRITQFKSGSNVSSMISNLSSNNCEHFAPSATIPASEKIDEHIISTDDSEYPIYLWYDSNTKTIHWYSEATDIYLNEDLSEMFYNQEKLIDIDFSNLKFNRVETMAYMFGKCKSLVNFDVDHFDTSNVREMHHMFLDCWALEEVDLSSLNFEKVEDLSYLFRDCKNLVSIDMHGMKLSSVTNMSYIFRSCEKLESVNLTGVETPVVQTMSYMFYYDSSIVSISLDGLGSDNLANIGGIFDDCSGLKNLSMTHFNFGNTYGINDFLKDPTNLETVDLSYSNITNNTNIFGSMFENCSNLKTLDISHINFSNVTTFNYFFHNSAKLETIYVSDDFTMNNSINANNSYYMFTGCTSLVGGNGTTYDSSKTDYTYARIDTPSNPGYFTLKA